MIQVRQALLGDASGITALYCSLIKRWSRLAPDGTRQELAYDDLNLYERWQYGGPWLAVETCAVWMGHLLQRNEGIPLVAELEGKIIGQAEVFIGKEPPPYGFHINISTICVREDFQRQGVGRALVQYIQQMAQVLKCERITAAFALPIPFWEALGFVPFMGRQRVRLKAEEGRVFYKARDLVSEEAEQVSTWFMPLGRYQSAREEWERMHWLMWAGVPQLVEANWHRLMIDLTGQPCITHLHQRDDDPRVVTARVWTKFDATDHVISAVVDRAARLGYSYVTTMVDTPHRGLLAEAEDVDELQWLYAKEI